MSALNTWTIAVFFPDRGMIANVVLDRPLRIGDVMRFDSTIGGRWIVTREHRERGRQQDVVHRDRPTSANRRAAAAQLAKLRLRPARCGAGCDKGTSCSRAG